MSACTAPGRSTRISRRVVGVGAWVTTACWPGFCQLPKHRSTSGSGSVGKSPARTRVARAGPNWAAWKPATDSWSIRPTVSGSPPFIREARLASSKTAARKAMLAVWAEFAWACSISASRSWTCRLTSRALSCGLADRLGEQLHRRLQVRRRYVEHRLQPRQGQLDPEAGPLGLQQLGELLAVVLPACPRRAPGRRSSPCPRAPRSSALSGMSSTRLAETTCCPGNA